MMNYTTLRLSNKKPARHTQHLNTRPSNRENQYEELLEKFNTTDAVVKSWMTRLEELTSEIFDLEDITQDALSEHLAAANGYGLNYTSTVFFNDPCSSDGTKYPNSYGGYPS